MKTLTQNLNCRIGKEVAREVNQKIAKVETGEIVIDAEKNLSTC